MPYKLAAALGGISVDTFCEWRRRFPEFSEAIQAATARGIHERLKLVKAAAEAGDVRAAQWWLEHVYPEHFARSRIEHQHLVAGAVTHDFVVTPDFLRQITESRQRYELANAGS